MNKNTFGPANRNVLIRELTVDLMTAGDEVIFTNPDAGARLRFVSATVDNISVLGTLATAPAVIIDNGTDGENITASKTLTSGATDQSFALAAATQPYVVTGDATIRLKKSVLGIGQATTFRARTDNVATLTTAAVHGFNIGDVVVVKTVGGTGYNGVVTVTAVPTTTTFSYANVGADEASAADTAGRVGAYTATILVVFA